jgi:murein L,D-transpeptidase YcbB/YkuD
VLVKKLFLAATVLSVLVVPGAAEAKKRPPAPAPYVAPRIAPTDPVEAYYFHHNDAPIWLRSADSKAALTALPGLLRRAQVEGLATGPQLAASVEAAIARSASGNPADAKAAEIAASNAWVAYVQTIKKAPAGMLFGYPHLAPQGSRPDQILLTAGAAPSLTQHIQRTAAPNALYVQLRDAAWAAMQANPGSGPDPRLMSNLERARVLPAGGRYVLVDTAAARLTMFENGRPVDSMKVVVGKQESPTPMIASMIYYATFNPYWNVPDNLVRKNIGPKALKGGEKYLKPQGFQVMSDWTENAQVLPSSSVDWAAVASGQKPIRIRQLPGPTNSMGKMKFNFRNSEDIYLHDTPQKEYFLKATRTLSNGCIRLEDAKRLGRWLMGTEPVPPSDQPELHVKLPQGVPVYVTYLTAQPGADGKLTYLNDAYGWDGRPDRQVAAASSQVPRSGL